MSVSCSNCGFAFENENHGRPCPKCGSHNRSITATEEIKSHELLKLRKKGAASTRHQHGCDQERISGERVGKNGQLVTIEQVVDQEQNVY